MTEASALARLDHLVYATPDVDATIAELEARLDVRATIGGSHPGRGTRNALIALSEFSYLEIIGPDLGQPAPPSPRWFGIDDLIAPRLVTWAIREPAIARASARAAARGAPLGAVGVGARTRDDGVTLRWTLTDPVGPSGDGLVPFLIDWGKTPDAAHPARLAPRGAVIESLRGTHPDPPMIEHALDAIGVELAIASAPEPALIAELRTSRGIVELR